MSKLVLASQSPRRKELLAQLEDQFSTVVPAIDETPSDDETPHDYVARLAQQKAMAGYCLCEDGSIVIGSDTIVVKDNVLLGKPRDKSDFTATMALLSGQTHQVYTAVAVTNGNTKLLEVVVSDVTFCHLNEADIEWYWQTGEPQDKAGGYGIQGRAGRFITRIEGSYSAVVGLPLYQTSQLIQTIRESKP